MLNKEPSPARAKQGFRESVLSSFGFLENFCLRPVEDKGTFVRYESSEVFVNVYHGRASHELGVEIGRLSEPERKLTIHSIIAWAGADKVEGQHVMFQVSSREGVREFVPKLAALVKKYAAPLLRGEESAYFSALEFQAKRWKEYVKEVNMRSVRNKAEAAWQAKDYVQVVEVFDPVRKDLTEVEAKKLAYAEHVMTAEGAGSRSPARRKR